MNKYNNYVSLSAYIISCFESYLLLSFFFLHIWRRDLGHVVFCTYVFRKQSNAIINSKLLKFIFVVKLKNIYIIIDIYYIILQGNDKPLRYFLSLNYLNTYDI